MLDLPIVDIAKEECTKTNVEQLASTRATSAIEIALAVSESPGHPYPCKFEGKKINEMMCRWIGFTFKIEPIFVWLLPLLYHQLSRDWQGWEWHGMGIQPSPSTAE